LSGKSFPDLSQSIPGKDFPDNGILLDKSGKDFPDNDMLLDKSGKDFPDNGML
jgi:hypothetical protein